MIGGVSIIGGVSVIEGVSVTDGVSVTVEMWLIECDWWSKGE